MEEEQTMDSYTEIMFSKIEEEEIKNSENIFPDYQKYPGGNDVAETNVITQNEERRELKELFPSDNNRESSLVYEEN